MQQLSRQTSVPPDMSRPFLKGSILAKFRRQQVFLFLKKPRPDVFGNQVSGDEPCLPEFEMGEQKIVSLAEALLIRCHDELVAG